MVRKMTTARPSLATLSARVTGFDFMYASFHAYTTVVTLEGASWSLGIRYSKFLSFFEALKATERSFKFDFPPRGGIFSKPKPEDRQVRLDAFLQAVTKFYQVKKQPPNVAKLLCEFLQVDRNYTRANKFPNKSESARLVEKPDAKVVSVSKATLSEMAHDGKTAQVNAATVVAASKDNAAVATNSKEMDRVTKIEKETAEENKIKKSKDEEKKEEEPKAIENKSVEVKVVEDNINEKKDGEYKSEGGEVGKGEVTKYEAEEKAQAETDVVKQLKVAEVKLEVMETSVEEVEVEETIVKEVEIEEITSSGEETVDGEGKVEVVGLKISKNWVEKVHEGAVTKAKDLLPDGTTTTSTTTTTTMGTTVVETNMTSQTSVNKTVVGKTVIITSKSDDAHSFKVEMSEKKASVVTLASSLKEIIEEGHKSTKKRRGRRKSMSSAPTSTVSTASDGFESPDGVDQLSRVSDLTLTEAQKKARNQRRKEKRKKNQKKLLASDLKE